MEFKRWSVRIIKVGANHRTGTKQREQGQNRENRDKTERTGTKHKGQGQNTQDRDKTNT